MARNTSDVHSLTPILDPARGRHYCVVPPELVPQARAEGCLLHHEYEEEVVSYYDDDVERDDGELEYHEDTVVTKDQWHAATPEWVADYHRSGGMWGYND